MKTKTGTESARSLDETAKSRRGKPKWVYRRVSTALSEEQARMLDELLATAVITNPMASLTTVMQEALTMYYALKHPIK